MHAWISDHQMRVAFKAEVSTLSTDGYYMVDLIKCSVTVRRTQLTLWQILMLDDEGGIYKFFTRMSAYKVEIFTQAGDGSELLVTVDADYYLSLKRRSTKWRKGVFFKILLSMKLRKKIV